MNEQDVYAHTPGPEGWDPLSKHLERTAELAQTFAKPFGGGDLAYQVGLWHDLGKCNPLFQEYLRAQNDGKSYPKQPHAIWGAALAYDLIWRRMGDAQAWKEIGLPIAGHHTGLDEAGHLAQEIERFLKNHPEALPTSLFYLRRLPNSAFCPTPHDSTRREFFIRMVFSALLDADRLDTERHFNPERSTARERWPQLPGLWQTLDTKLREKSAHSDNTPVNRVRREVLESCRSAADDPAGAVYRLTVPTGGGKTLSGLAFALRHAVAKCLRRVVVAVPYTSIIDQTVRAYRDVLGEEAVLEHHSQVEVREGESEDPSALAAELATENWNSPLIVTTTVQLFESLLGNRTSRVRKLHNLARSVIILDEVQTLPPELLEPTLDVLRTLVEEYGTTVMLSTATQPALDDSPYLKAFRGIGIQEIVPNYQQHFAELQRVSFEIAPAPMSWDDIAEYVRSRSQIMVVLNRRTDALELIRRLKGAEGVCHLSTLLCGAHRRIILDDIRVRLDRANPRPVRLISTQVVEAGVDLDFPEVWRAIGPLDRIVQAAGRCNREGLRPERGRVVIFEPAEGGIPGGPYQRGMEEAKVILHRYHPEDLHQPDVYRHYFQKLYAVVDPDRRRIQPRRSALDYPSVARHYRLIESDTVPVVVRYGDAEERLTEWRRHPTRRAWQRLQPFVVNVYEREIRHLREWGLEQITEGLYFWPADYDNLVGLSAVSLDPADLIV